MNHNDNHKFSSYCHIITIMKVLYNKVKHKNIKDSDIVTEIIIRYAKLKLLNVG